MIRPDVLDLEDGLRIPVQIQAPQERPQHEDAPSDGQHEDQAKDLPHVDGAGPLHRGRKRHLICSHDEIEGPGYESDIEQGVQQQDRSAHDHGLHVNGCIHDEPKTVEHTQYGQWHDDEYTLYYIVTLHLFPLKRFRLSQDLRIQNALEHGVGLEVQQRARIGVRRLRRSSRFLSGRLQRRTGFLPRQAGFRMGMSALQRAGDHMGIPRRAAVVAAGSRLGLPLGSLSRRRPGPLGIDTGGRLLFRRSRRGRLGLPTGRRRSGGRCRLTGRTMLRRIPRPLFSLLFHLLFALFARDGGNDPHQHDQKNERIHSESSLPLLISWRCWDQQHGRSRCASPCRT